MSYIMNLRKKIGTEPLIMVGACVLIFNEHNELLMQLRNDNNCWGLAGGAMDLGESLEEVAQREMLEETGLKAIHLEYFKTFSGKDFYYRYPHGDEVYNVVTAFICKKYDGLLKYNFTESKSIKFFNLAHLPLNISPPDKLVIEEYFRTIVVDYL
ncbi:NUDIX hydrolase [Solibacillus sp. FSL R7-0682]|uniref:NUDIX hydrolase n=1 Tax=Solibacillus sp. FSL R7-0682 TaxID=2921690 RepID=UPI0030F526EB